MACQRFSRPSSTSLSASCRSVARHFGFGRATRRPSVPRHGPRPGRAASAARWPGHIVRREDPGGSSATAAPWLEDWGDLRDARLPGRQTEAPVGSDLRRQRRRGRRLGGVTQDHAHGDRAASGSAEYPCAARAVASSRLASSTIRLRRLPSRVPVTKRVADYLHDSEPSTKAGSGDSNASGSPLTGWEMTSRQGVQGDPRRKRPAAAVLAVPHDRVAAMGQLQADLVLAARLDLHLQQRRVLATSRRGLQPPVARAGPLAPRASSARRSASRGAARRGRANPRTRPDGRLARVPRPSPNRSSRPPACGTARSGAGRPSTCGRAPPRRSPGRPAG